jgi:Na+/H+ antiporter NhaD/arsenite permease-like protein
MWHDHYGKVTTFWSLAFAIPFTQTVGVLPTFYSIWGTFLHHYFPFIVIVFGLVSITGGIRISLPARGTPSSNLAILSCGAFLAGWIGTTGASMLLIRPLLAANRWRQYKTHLLMFFIFLVSNIGGGLTPLGDPPLFLGFLNGVPFSWTIENLWKPLLFISIPLLALHYGLDWYYFSQKEDRRLLEEVQRKSFHVRGLFNGLLLVGILGTVMISGQWQGGPVFEILGVHLPLTSLLRDGIILGLGLLSMAYTNPHIREENHFSWDPVTEVGILFAGIFMTLIPISSILQAKNEGALASLLDLVTTPGGGPDNVMYFWLSGLLSAFLDNTPTYMLFFNVAGGDALVLTTTLKTTLMAISLGAVCMGAMTYIGNAPNFMVRVVARNHHIKMPSFFGFFGWSCLFLLPLFLLTAWVFF